MKIKASMVESQNPSIPPTFTNLVKPKKRKRIAKEVDQSSDKID